jgi:hypothetical protein
VTHLSDSTNAEANHETDEKEQRKGDHGPTGTPTMNLCFGREAFWVEDYDVDRIPTRPSRERNIPPDAAKRLQSEGVFEDRLTLPQNWPDQAELNRRDATMGCSAFSVSQRASSAPR